MIGTILHWGHAFAKYFALGEAFSLPPTNFPGIYIYIQTSRFTITITRYYFQSKERYINHTDSYDKARQTV